jgi:WhiB family transcriptional regulator, redox-sensing transcriptional regulator
MSPHPHVEAQGTGRPLAAPVADAGVVVDLAGRQRRHTATPRIPAGGWWAAARCNDGSGRLARLFFSQDLRDIARAQRICATCTALVPCLEGAIERREPRGVWGGQLFVDGRIVATKRRPGRPRKVPAPHDQLPERPLPEHLRGVTAGAQAGRAETREVHDRPRGLGRHSVRMTAARETSSRDALPSAGLT